MQRLEVSGAVRPIYVSLGVKRLTQSVDGDECSSPGSDCFTSGVKAPDDDLWWVEIKFQLHPVDKGELSCFRAKIEPRYVPLLFL